MPGRCRDAAANVGVAAAQIAARAHQDVNDGFELLVAIIDDRAGLTRAPEDADIGGGDIVEMLLIADRREIFGFVEDAQELRHLADEIEEGAEAFDFLPCRMCASGALADEVNHIGADLRQQLIEQFLTVLEMIVERSLRDTGLLGNAGNRSLGVTHFADDLGGGVEDLALGPGVALGPVEFCHLARCGLR